MEPRNEIAVELRALSDLVGGISRQNPYGVPEGYFMEFPALVLARVAGAPQTFQVPPGYFDGLAGQVLSRVRAEAAQGEFREAARPQESVSEELARISTTLGKIGRETPYRIPEGYFDEQAPLLAVLKDIPAYRVPAEYFEEIVPVLVVAREGTAYQVPETYFETIPAEVLAKTARQTARVIPMNRRERAGREAGSRLKRGWWEYSSIAAAACVLLILGWPQLNTHNTTNAAKKPVGADIVRGLQDLSDQEIQAYLDEQHSFVADPAANSTTTLDMNEGEVKNLLGDASDSDLQQYLEEHGKAEDIATN